METAKYYRHSNWKQCWENDSDDIGINDCFSYIDGVHASRVRHLASLQTSALQLQPFIPTSDTLLSPSLLTTATNNKATKHSNCSFQRSISLAAVVHT